MRWIWSIVVVIGVCGLAGSARAGNVTASPSSYNFGNVSVSAGVQTTNIDLMNTGSNTTVNDLTLGSGCAEFSVASSVGLPATVTSTVPVTISVDYNPADRAADTCTITIVCSGTCGAITVTGDGTASQIAVTMPVSQSIMFASQRVSAGPPDTQNIVITNTGEEAVTPAQFSGTMMTGTQGFSVGVLSGTILGGGGTATLPVTFDPSSLGPKADTVLVSVTNDSPNDPVRMVTVTGAGVDSGIAASPSPLAFGNVGVAVVGGSVLNLTLTNNGTASLNTSSMTISGDASFSFAFPSGLCTSGQSCTRVVTAVSGGGTAMVPIRCDPSTMGSKTGILTIQSDAPLSPTTVNLTCTGGSSMMGVSPSTLTFANQRVNTSSSAMNITVTNTGTATLNYSVTETTDFQASIGATQCNPTCAGQTVGAGGMATVAVVFRPVTAGNKSGPILIDDVDNLTTDVNVAASGTGVEALSVLDAPVPGTPPTTGGALAFGNVTNGTTSTSQMITLRNNGTAVLTVSNVVNTSTGDFDLTGPTTTTIAAGATQSWMVTCDPETRGAKAGTILIANDSTNDSSVDVALSCTSIEGLLVASAAPVAVSAGSINFGPVRLNTSVATTVTLANQGNVGVTISAINLGSSTEGFSISGFTANTVVAANGGTTTFTVTFLPTTDPQGATTMTINSDWNDPVLNLVGDGQPSGCSVTPDPVNLGNVRWDQTADQIVTVSNVGTASFQFTGAVLTGTQASEFQLVGVTTGLIATGANRTFTLRANPSDTMLGARSVQLQIVSDLPAGMGCATITASYTSVGPAVTLSPGMTVDFGGVDIDAAGGAQIPLTITNSGDGLMTITNIGALTAPFSKTATASMTINPGGMQTITVTYTPTVERAATNPETQTFTVTTTGLYSGGTQQPASFQITVRGYGTDRHITVGDVMFPDTYRNPTAAQVPTAGCGAGHDQMCALHVCNTGGARLDISMLSDPGSPFEVATGSFMVQGGSASAPTCMDVPVAFRPASIDTFMGSVTITNNDDGAAMSVVQLTGAGVRRPIEVTPHDIDLGTVPTGTDVDLDGLVIANASATDSFEVSELRVAGADLTLEATGSIAPGTHPLAAVLHAEKSGDFTATVTIYLDGDPEAPDTQATFVIHGKAVDRRDYYTCSSGGGGGAAGGAASGLAIAGLLAIGRRRRRYRRAATPTAGTTANGR